MAHYRMLESVLQPPLVRAKQHCRPTGRVLAQTMLQAQLALAVHPPEERKIAKIGFVVFQ
jgi:hypothetical protein